MEFTVYMLRTSGNTLYIGQTNNLERRLHEHKIHGSKAAKYVRTFESFELVYTETFPTRSEAMKREAKMKTFTRAKKEELCISSQTHSH